MIQKAAGEHGNGTWSENIAQVEKVKARVPGPLALLSTTVTGCSRGSWISGLTYVTGNAAKRAAEGAMGKLLEVAAQELDTDPADLEAKNKEIFRTPIRHQGGG